MDMGTFGSRSTTIAGALDVEALAKIVQQRLDEPRCQVIAIVGDAKKAGRSLVVGAFAEALHATGVSFATAPGVKSPAIVGLVDAFISTRPSMNGMAGPRVLLLLSAPHDFAHELAGAHPGSVMVVDMFSHSRTELRLDPYPVPVSPDSKAEQANAFEARLEADVHAKAAHMSQTPACPASDPYSDVKRAGQVLQSICHTASYDAGWWHLPKAGTDPWDLRWLIRAAECAPRPRKTALGLLDLRTRFGKALVAEKLCLIHSEVSEAMEGWRKDAQDDKLPARKMIEVELADAVIRIADLAGALELDLGGAIAEKMAYNAQRADHKPEARAATGGKSF